MTHMTMNDVEAFIRCSKDVMDLYRALTTSLPKGQSRDDAERRLADAEKALRASEVQLAKSLDYHLCQCTFPPQIMLSQGRHHRYGDEIFKCERCSKQIPPEKTFRDREEVERQFGQQDIISARY